MFWQIQERKGGAIMPTSRRSPYGVHENDPFLFFNEWYGKATHCIALFQLRNDELRSQCVNYWCTFFKRYFWCQVICFMWKGFTLKIGKLAAVTNFFCCLYIFRFTFIINSCKILKIFSSFFFKVSVISGLQFQLCGDLAFSVFFVRRDNGLEDWILVCSLHKKVGFSVFKGISKASEPG